MAATDQPYRSQKALDIIFGVTCGALLFSTVWMFWVDYAREYKTVQRTFRDVEASIAERDLIDRMPDAAAVAALRDSAQSARERLKQQQKYLLDTDRKLKARYDSLDIAYRDIKADYDAQMSYYNIAADAVGKVPLESPRHKTLKDAEARERARLDKLDDRLAVAKKNLDAIELEIKT